MKNIIRGFVLYFTCCMLIGVYTIIIHWVGIALWKNQARGSLIKSLEGEIRGSFLLGQEFSFPKYFKARPRNILDNQCNLQFYLSPYKEVIASRIESERENIKYIELIVPSASLLDPYISLGAALSQIPEIAKYHGILEADLERLVGSHTTKAQWPFFDMNIVNVVRLNGAVTKFYAK